MDSLLAILIGFLVSMGIYCILRRSLIRLVIGIMLLSQAANLLIFSSAALTKGKPPLIPETATTLSGDFADPLPQALVLTAIVIGFGFIAFLLALLLRAYKTLKTDDIEQLNKTDRGL